MYCEKAENTSKMKFRVFFSLNQARSYVVNELDFQKYQKITRNDSEAEALCMDLIASGQIPFDSERIDTLHMSTDGINYKRIVDNTTVVGDEEDHYSSSEFAATVPRAQAESSSENSPISTQQDPSSSRDKITPIVSEKTVPKGPAPQSKRMEYQKISNESRPGSSNQSTYEKNAKEKLEKFRYNMDQSSCSERGKNRSDSKVGASNSEILSSRNVSLKIPKGKTSKVWKLFIPVEEGGECRLCNHYVKAPSNTTNLFNHLYRKHDESEYKCLLNSVQSANDSNNNDKKKDDVRVQRDEPKAVTNTLEKLDKQKSNTSVKIQPRIDKTMGQIASYRDGGAMAARIKNALLFTIAKDDLPLSSTEKEGMNYLLSILASNYKIPKKKAMTIVLEQKYDILQNFVKQKLTKAKYVTLTADIFTETMSTRGFLGITAHFLDGSKLTSINLAAEELSESRTAEYFSGIFEKTLTFWGLQKEKITAVVTDGGGNMKKSVKDTFGPQKHMECFAHKLNLTVRSVIDSSEEFQLLIAKVKDIVKFFKQSTTAADELRKAQRDEQDCRLIQDVSTRWNTTYYMLSRFLKLVDVVGPILLKIRTSPPLLTAEEIVKVKDAVELLKPAERLTAEFSGEKYVTSSKVIPALYCLQETISEIKSDTALGKNLTTAMLKELDKQFPRVDQQFHLATATLLDPRYKKMYFLCPTGYSNLLRAVDRQLLSKRSTPKEPEDLSPEKPNDTDDVWRHHRNRIKRQKTQQEESSTETTNVDLRQYLKKENLLVADPISYWLNQKENCPELAEVALKYLSTVATSVPCERLFSLASNIVTENRNRLSSKHISMFLFLKSLSFDEWHIDC